MARLKGEVMSLLMKMQHCEYYSGNSAGYNHTKENLEACLSQRLPRFHAIGIAQQSQKENPFTISPTSTIPSYRSMLPSISFPSRWVMIRKQALTSFHRIGKY